MAENEALLEANLRKDINAEKEMERALTTMRRQHSKEMCKKELDLRDIIENRDVEISMLKIKNARLERQVFTLKGKLDTAADHLAATEKVAINSLVLEKDARKRAMAKNKELQRTKKRAALRLEGKERQLKKTRNLVAKLQDTIEDWKDDEKKALTPLHNVVTRTTERGRPYSPAYEAHSRMIMSLGISAEAAKQSIALNKAFFLGHEAAAKLETPELNWFKKQRESLGLQSWVYSMVEIAGADTVNQFGFDETKISGQSTFNQWVSIMTNGVLKIVTLEAGGILVDGTAAGVASHVELTWHRGNEVIGLLREDLIAHHGLEVTNQLVPLRRGGIKLLKIGSTMTDTCNTMVGKKGGAVLHIEAKKKQSGIGQYGEVVVQF